MLFVILLFALPGLGNFVFYTKIDSITVHACHVNLRSSKDISEYIQV